MSFTVLKVAGESNAKPLSSIAHCNKATFKTKTLLSYSSVFVVGLLEPQPLLLPNQDQE